jgi:hypothetical protein
VLPSVAIGAGNGENGRVLVEWGNFYPPLMYHATLSGESMITFLISAEWTVGPGCGPNGGSRYSAWRECGPFP